MNRKIIKIDENKCVGCGLCVEACHEGALGLVNGKARLLKEDYCDGLGNCLPVCPAEAITLTTADETPHAQGCPGARSQTLKRKSPEAAGAEAERESQLRQWPIQIKLVPSNAAYFDNAHVLVAADCAAYAYGNFHTRFMRNKITLIGCPKLDQEDYSSKLTEILRNNAIKSVTVVRMEVPCCGGIEHAVKTALEKSGKTIPWQIVTLSTDGGIIDTGVS